MKKNKPVLIIPFDGYTSGEKMFTDIKDLLADNDIAEVIAFLKFNDAVHMEGAKFWLSTIQRYLQGNFPHIGIFLDLKLPDVSATNLNILKHHFPADLLTIDASVTADTLIKIREKYPTTKLALYSVPTDMKEEECAARYGMPPALKIYTDWLNIQRLYNKHKEGFAFDYLICSVHENEFLRKIVPSHLGFINPGIRDEWMLNSDGSKKDHQQRVAGIRFALNSYTSYAVMGAQIMKGNPDRGITAEESRKRTLAEMKGSPIYMNSAEIGLLELLKRYDGYYESPKDENGNYIGPLVAYAGRYDDEAGNKKNYVGNIYLNFAKVDQHPIALERFAEEIINQSRAEERSMGNVFLGAPEGGRQLATMLGLLGIVHRSVFAEKKIISQTDSAKGTREESIPVLKRYELNAGDEVVLVEDVINNFSTTEKMKEEIEKNGGNLKTIVCAINRSGKTEWNGIPIIAALEIPTAQYKQNDPQVRKRIEDGKIVWKPKEEWQTLKKAMEDAA